MWKTKSHPYKNTGKTVVLHISTFILLANKLEDKIICTKWQQIFPDCNLLLISSRCDFDLLWLFPNIWTLPSSQSIHYLYRYAPHNDISVNDGPHIRRWSHTIIIYYYNTTVLQLPTVFSTVTCCTGL
jgi:hypothetical protein